MIPEQSKSMNLQKYLWQTSENKSNNLNTSLQSFLEDVKNLRFARVFSTNNDYHQLRSFHMTNCAFRILLFIAKNKVNESLSFTLSAFLDSIHNNCEENEEVSADAVCHFLLYLMHGLFMKENWVGPSYLSSISKKVVEKNYKIDHCKKYILDFSLHKSIQKLLAANNLDQKTVEQFPFNVVKEESFLKKNIFDPKEFEALDQFLAVDGEDYLKNFKLLDLFVVMKQMNQEMILRTSEKNALFNLKLLRARIWKLHNQMMDSPCNSILVNIKKSYSDIIKLKEEETVNENFEEEEKVKLLCHLKIEYAFALQTFYEFKISKTLILEAMNLLGLEVSFTGKLGVKTKYQTFKIPQLVIEINSKNAHDNANVEEQSKNEGPKVVPLDTIFDNILYEKPVLDNFLAENSIDQTVEINLVLLALMSQMTKSHANDDQIREKAMTFLSNVILNFKDWSIMMSALISRSNLEFSITKKMERSMLQFEQITLDWHGKEHSLVQRLRYAHVVNLPSYNSVISNLALNYTRIACFMSAFVLYKDLGLHTKSIECLFVGGQKGQAIEYLGSLPESYKNQPSIQCILGDIYRNPEFYEKAIEISNRKYAPAFRSLGGFYFSAKNYELSLEKYLLAVELNEFNISSWLRIAFIFMNAQKTEEAINSYKKVVFINENESGAWMNLALLYRKIGKGELAFDSIMKSVSIKERNWNAWYNVILISLENKNFTSFIKACLKMIELDKAEELKDFIVKKFFIILDHLSEELDTQVSSIRQFELMLTKFHKKNYQDF